MNKNKTHHKIWIDLENSPHVLFFTPIIEELKKRGHQVIVTVRDYAQVCALSDLFHLEYKKIGMHFGKNKILKLFGLLMRVIQLVPVLWNEKPDLALSHGSRSQLLLAITTGLPSIMTIDYEHSQWLPFIHPTLTIVPEVIPDSVIEKHVNHFSKYPGIKEDVYAQNFVPDSAVLSSLGVDDKEIVVTIRPPATAAHYHTSRSDELFRAVIDHITRQPETRIIMLPRTEEQTLQIKKMWPQYFDREKIIIPKQVLNGLNLIWHSDLVISAGGTMIREAAALDVPAYSIFGGKIGAVDRYLATTGRLTLLDGSDDVRTRIVIKKRHRPVNPATYHRPALMIIVDAVDSVLKGR